jgi:hypothetical protein
MEKLRKVIGVNKTYQSKCPDRDGISYCPICPFSYSEDAPEDEFYECWDCTLQIGHHWLRETKEFRFYSAEEYDGELFEVYVDDYGQSFVLAWIDPVDCKVQEWSCGLYNDYTYDMEDIAAFIKERRNQVHKTKGENNE